MEDKRRNVLRLIVKKTEADLRRYGKMPFDVILLALITAEQNATIAELAKIIETLLPPEDNHE